GLPNGATLVPGPVYGTAIFTWTPNAADAGLKDITFTATDSGNGDASDKLSSTQHLLLNVRTGNVAPVLAPVGNLTFVEGQARQVQLVAIDADDDPVSFTATNLPAGASLSASGVLSYTPGFQAAGNTPGIKITATDGAGSSSETIAITVQNVNQAPVI